MRVFVTVVILAFAGLVLLLPEVEARPLSKGELRTIQQAAADYVRETDEKTRKKIWKAISAKAKRLDFTAVAAVAKGAIPGTALEPGFHHDVPFEAEGETWTYSVHVPKGGPRGKLPLVVDPGHGSLKDAGPAGLEDVMGNWLRVSGAMDDVIYVRTRVIDKLSKDGRYEKWTVPPRRPSGKPSYDTIARIMLAAIGDACRRYPIDPDRVYVQGISQTGFWAWWLGAYAPDRFAAVCPVGAVTWHVRSTLGNLRATNVFVLHGTNDPTCQFAQAESAVKTLEGLKAPVHFTPVEGGLHMQGVFVKWKELWPKVAKTTRNPFPTSFERAFVSPTRPDAFWVRARDLKEGEFNPWKAPAHVKGRIEEQTIHLEAKGMRGLTVYLAPEMLDLEKRVTIRVNDRRMYAGQPKPDLRKVLDLVRERGDGVGFATAVEVEVP